MQGAPLKFSHCKERNAAIYGAIALHRIALMPHRLDTHHEQSSTYHQQGYKQDDQQGYKHRNALTQMGSFLSLQS